MSAMTAERRPDSFLSLVAAGPDAPPVSVHVDPLPTVLTSLVEVFGPLSPRLPVALRRAVKEAARWVPVRTLVDLTLGGPDNLTAPGLLTPTSLDGGTSFSEQVERIRETPETVLAQDLTVYGQFDSDAARRWRRDPSRALRDYCSGLTMYWRSVIVPLYPDLERRLQREAARLEAGVDAYGYETVLSLLHPAARFEDGRLRLISSYSTGQAAWSSDELMIKPMIAAPMTWYSNIGAADNPWVTKAFLAVAPPNLRPWSPGEATADPPLEQLIGRPRGQILRSLRHRPGTTTDLAHELGLLPSTTSYHLKALRSADVVAPTRRRTGVYYRLTERGARLVAI